VKNLPVQPAVDGLPLADVKSWLKSQPPTLENRSPTRRVPSRRPPSTSPHSQAWKSRATLQIRLQLLDLGQELLLLGAADVAPAKAAPDVSVVVGWFETGAGSNAGARPFSSPIAKPKPQRFHCVAELGLAD
jgi:hypothetical protein